MIAGFTCPCCGKEIPVQIDVNSKHVDEGLIIMDDATFNEGEAWPHITLNPTLDLQAVIENLDDLKARYEAQKANAISIFGKEAVEAMKL